MGAFVTAEELQFACIPSTEFIVTTFNLVFDESGKKDRSHIVYAGILIDSSGAPNGAPSAWNELSRHWLALLQNSGLNYFHATEAFNFGGPWKRFKRRSDERDDLLRALANLVNEYPREANASIISVSDFNEMDRGLRAGYKDDPFNCAFETGVLAAVRQAGVLAGDNFNLICDDSEENAPACLAAYRRFRKNHPDVAKRIGTICFGDDEKIVPLQMADMFGFCLRKKAEGAPDGIWREILNVFLSSDAAITTRPVVIRPESGRALFMRRSRFLLSETRRLLFSGRKDPP